MPLIHAEPDALARVYAQAIHELAISTGGQALCERILGELEDVLELARADAKFSELLSSRIVPAPRRAAALDRIFRGRADDLTVSVLRTLNGKGRLSHLPAIVAALDQIVQAAFGRVEVDVYTASPAAPESLESIRARLEQTLGKQPVIHAYVEPSMIGGVKLQIGDRLIDGSIATRLRKMRDALNQSGAARVRADADSIIREK